MCQQCKKSQEFVACLESPPQPPEPFKVPSMDKMRPYPKTARKNRYMLIFIDHFAHHTEAFLIPNQPAETCARMCATEIIT